MEQWRKRISRIATSFEIAHKEELKSGDKPALESKSNQPLQQASFYSYPAL